MKEKHKVRKSVFVECLIICLLLVVAVMPAFVMTAAGNEKNYRVDMPEIPLNGNWINYDLPKDAYAYCPVYLNQNGLLSLTVQTYYDKNHYIYLLDSNLEKVDYDNRFGKGSASPETVDFVYFLTAGQYYVRVESWNDVSGPFRIKGEFTPARTNETEPNNTFEQSQVLTPGQEAIRGFLSTACTAAFWADPLPAGTQDFADYYLFSVGQGVWNISVSLLETMKTYFKVTLYDSNHEELIVKYLDETETIQQELDAGTYYLAVESSDRASGQYAVALWEDGSAVPRVPTFNEEEKYIPDDDNKSEQEDQTFDVLPYGKDLYMDYEIIPDGTYFIYSALDPDMVIDAYARDDWHNGTNIQIYSFHGGINQQFELTYQENGWYTIICQWNQLSLDVEGGSLENGTNVLLWSAHGNENQLWRLIPAGDGYYYIQNGLGTVLDVCNFGTENETNIQSYEYNGGSNQKWMLVRADTENDQAMIINDQDDYAETENEDYARLVDLPGYEIVPDGTYIIRSAMDLNKVVDAYGNEELQNGTNIQICSYNGGINQQFDLVHMGDGWFAIICQWGRKSLDIDHGSTKKETNIFLWDWNGGSNQLWRFVPTEDGYYYIQSALGTVVDVYNFGTEDETNIQSYEYNGGSNQKWQLTLATGTNSKVEAAISWGMSIAEDNSHGYNMNSRNGNPDYDCSSFVCSAFHNAGFNVSASLATPSMRKAFQDAGFQWIPWNNIGNVSNLKRGDILLNENSGKNGHTEIYIGNNQILGARGGNQDGKPGDSYGTEICVKQYSGGTWHGVLRYNGQ